MKNSLVFLFISFIFTNQLFSQIDRDTSIVYERIKSNEKLDIQYMIDKLENKEVISMNLFFTDNDRSRYKWIAYFQNLKKEAIAPIEFKMYTFPEETNKYPKFSGDAKDHLISEPSLFILQHAGLDLSTLNRDFDKVKFEIIKSQSDYELVRVSKIIDSTSSSKSCGPIQYDLFQEPIKEYVSRYSLFYFHTQLNGLKKNDIVNKQRIDSLLSNQNIVLRSLVKENVLKRNKLVFSYSFGLSKIQMDNPNTVLSASRNNLFAVNVNTLIGENSQRGSLNWGLAIGSASFDVHAPEFTSEYFVSDNNSQQYTRKTFYSNWNESAYVDYFQFPLEYQYRLTKLNKSLNVSLSSGISLFYLHSFSSFVNSGSYSVQGKFDGIKDYLENIPELSLYSNPNVSPMELYNKSSSLSVSWGAGLHIGYAITSDISIQTNLSYNLYPNLINISLKDNDSLNQNRDLISVIEQSKVIKLPKINLGVGLILNLK